MVIRIYGMPVWVGSVLPNLAEDLKRNVCGVPEAHLEPSNVHVFFPTELEEEGTGKELLSFVDTERKEAGFALNALGQAVGATLREFARIRLLGCRTIEVLVRPNHTGDEVIAYSL